MLKKMVGSAIAVALVLSGGAVASGGAVESGGSLDVSPDTVTPGDFTTVSNAVGSECVGELVVGNFTVRPGAWSVVPDGDGNWSVDLQVPPNGQPDAMGNETPFPPGEYEVFAHCYANCPEQFSSQCGAEAESTRSFAARGESSADFEYKPATVTVVAGEDPPPSSTPGTPTTDAGTPTTAAPGGGAVKAADAAKATSAQPTFTG